VELKALAADSVGPMEIVVPPRQAVARALAEATADDVILISGSLFVVGEVLAAWPVEPAAQRQPLRQGDDA
jgi:folylpolyglutamate synthase/dihydropteroate synthase